MGPQSHIYLLGLQHEKADEHFSKAVKGIEAGKTVTWKPYLIVIPNIYRVLLLFNSASSGSYWFLCYFRWIILGPKS